MSGQDDEVEDMWSVVRERNALRVRVNQLETELRKLHTVIDGRRGRMQLKTDDGGGRDTPTTAPHTSLTV